jgi:hypothetical protein
MAIKQKQLSDYRLTQILKILVAAQSDLLKFKYPGLNVGKFITAFIEVVRILGGIEGLDRLASESKRVQKIEERIGKAAA